MMKNCYLLLLIFTCCNHHDVKKPSKDDFDEKREMRAAKYKPVYKRVWLNLTYSSAEREEIELYISPQNDTISNQYKLFVNDVVDLTKSSYYDLAITQSDKQDVYNAQIKLNTGFNLKLNKSRRMNIYFSYREETRDSTYFTDIEVNNSNVIDFQFTNVSNNGLQGVVIQNIEIDTVINNEDYVRMIEYRLLVDNLSKTPNYSLTPFKFDVENKFHLSNNFKISK